MQERQSARISSACSPSYKAGRSRWDPLLTFWEGSRIIMPTIRTQFYLRIECWPRTPQRWSWRPWEWQRARIDCLQTSIHDSMSILGTFPCEKWQKCRQRALRIDIHGRVIFLGATWTRRWRRGSAEMRQRWRNISMSKVRCQLEVLTTQSSTTSTCSPTTTQSPRPTSLQPSSKTQERGPKPRQQSPAPKILKD